MESRFRFRGSGVGPEVLHLYALSGNAEVTCLIHIMNSQI